MTMKIIMMLAFIAVTVYIGYYARKSTRDVDGFVLGGRKVGPWLSAFAYGTTYFSAVVFVGYAGQFGWKYGMAVIWVGLGNAFVGSLLAWYVLGARTRAMTHHLKAQTMPEFFGARFSNQALRIAAAAIIFIFLIPYTASVYNGLSRLFDMAFGVPYEWCVIVMAVLTCIYVVMGGYMATAINDVVQGCVMLFGIVAVIIAVLMKYGGFTLIELLVVVLIIGILAAIALPMYQRAVLKTRIQSLATNVKSIYDAQKRYFLTNGTHTDRWQDLDIDFGGATISNPVNVTNGRETSMIWNDLQYYLRMRADGQKISVYAQPTKTCNTSTGCAATGPEYGIFAGDKDIGIIGGSNGSIFGHSYAQEAMTCYFNSARTRRICEQLTNRTTGYFPLGNAANHGYIPFT